MPNLTTPVAPQLGGLVTRVTASRSLTNFDSDRKLQVTTSLSLTVPEGLSDPNFFSILALLSGVTLTLVPGSANVLLNGTSANVTRAAASNVLCSISRRFEINSYDVSGS